MYEKQKERNKFVTILSDGTIRVPAELGTEGAVTREIEMKDGSKKTKVELVYSALIGTIKDIYFNDTDFGTFLNIKVDGGEEEVVISIQNNSNFATDIMKKLPNINLGKQVKFAPYAYTDDNGKKKSGVSLYQDGVAVKSYFYDDESKKSKNDFPEPEGDTSTYTKDDWKIYFLKVGKFLKNYTTEKIAPKILKEQEAGFEYPESEGEVAF